jgi:hypothetical protein
MEIKRVVGLQRIMGVAPFGFGPVDDLADVLDQGLALGQVLQGKNTFAMYPRAANLNAAVINSLAWFRHV